MGAHITFNKSLRRIKTCERDKLFAYFVGLLGLSGIVYTYLYSHVISSKYPDIRRVYRGNTETVHAGSDVIYSRGMRRKLGLDDENYPEQFIDSSISFINQNRSRDNLPVYNFVISETEIKRFFKTKYRNTVMNKCRKIFDGDSRAQIDATIRMSRSTRTSINNKVYKQMTSNCSKFISDRGYIDSPVTREEKEFPLAFSIIAYKQVEQIERLLRAIYRTQNFYCIHLDNKTLEDDVITMTSIADCFPNVFMSSRSVDVRWGKFSVLEAELVCMRDLWNKTGWKYFINLTGQEFPLKTNLEIVQILKSLKGANLVDGTWIRARDNYYYRWLEAGKPPPHNIRPIKGSVHVCVNRDFVDFALHDERSLHFLEWLKETMIPDETFFSSLNHNPALRIPGSFLGEPEEYPQKPSFTRYKTWEIGHGVWVRSCSGKYVRNICVLGVGDLPRMKNDIGLFVNKFHLDYQYIAYECMEEFIYQKTREQYLYHKPIDVSFYAMLDQVKLRYVKEDKNDGIELTQPDGV